jgi:uroporphyrin-III C-methyltransferase/precorrin-2 dehydrogenase/sirohydrochlorin ferrochelatase
MPKKTIAELTARAIASGLLPDTPAVAVAAATRADETGIAGTVADIAVKLGALPLTGPVLVLIGRVFAEVGVARMEPTGQREAPPDDRLRKIRGTVVN